MSAAEMAARVGGPTYLSGSWLGTAAEADAASGAGAPSVVREADEQPDSSTVVAQPTANNERFTRTPWLEMKGPGRRLEPTPAFLTPTRPLEMWVDSPLALCHPERSEGSLLSIPRGQGFLAPLGMTAGDARNVEAF
jgi:hypothetical protein